MNQKDKSTVQQKEDVLETLTTSHIVSDAPIALQKNNLDNSPNNLNYNKLKNPVKIDFFIKRPDGKFRKSFSIIKRSNYSNNQKLNEALDHENLKTINKLFKNGLIDFSDANYQVERLLNTLQERYRKDFGLDFKISDSNMKLLNQYWDAEYIDRKIKSRESAKQRLTWGLQLIDKTSLLADRKVLQVTVDAVTAGDKRKQRRLCSVLNQMRKYFGISEKLRAEKKTLPDFRYLKESEFLKVLDSIYVGSRNKASVDSYKLLFKVLFYSGVRTGEAFALKEDHFNNVNTLKVQTQLERGHKEAETKNGQIRSTFLLDFGVEAFQEWARFKNKSHISRHGLAEVIKRACKRAFPYDQSKWITAHDLRHSYAVMMLTKFDLSITQIAKLLGNSVVVCEEYYLRFQHSDDLIETIGRKIHRKE